MFEWLLSVSLAPSIRGWMLAAPGVAMNNAMWPPDGSRLAMCSPICCPDTNRSCPMYASRAVEGSSALYATTGMPADSAFATGDVNACGSISEVAMPSAFAVTAELMELTIWPTLLESEPVQL